MWQFKKFTLLFILFMQFSVANALESHYCNLIPTQQSESDIPVEFGFSALPNSNSNIVQVINYDTLINRDHLRNENDPRVHSHIWIIDKTHCKKILILPLPIDASINVQGGGSDTKAIPIIQLPNGNLEFKYAFSIPEKPQTIFIRKIIVNTKWEIIDKQDVELQIKSDARKIVNLADWDVKGRILDISEPIDEHGNALHSLIYFNAKQIVLYQFAIDQPEFQFTQEGIVLDDTRPYNLRTYYPRYFLITAFNPNLKYFRQFTMPIPNGSQINHVYFIDSKNRSFIKIHNTLITVYGMIVEPKNLENTFLPDYKAADQLNAADITVSLWQNNQWVKTNQLQPIRLQSIDLKQNASIWIFDNR